MADEDDSYVLREDGSWKLTPSGLARWADEEGGWESLLYGNGEGPFLEAGVDPDILAGYEFARDRMEAELDRIGATL